MTKVLAIRLAKLSDIGVTYAEVLAVAKRLGITPEAAAKRLGADRGIDL